MLGIQAKEFNLCFMRPENFVSHDLRVCQGPFGKLQTGCYLPFTGEASVWPISAALHQSGLFEGVLQRWLSFWKVILSPQRNAEALLE